MVLVLIAVFEAGDMQVLWVLCNLKRVDCALFAANSKWRRQL